VNIAFTAPSEIFFIIWNSQKINYHAPLGNIRVKVVIDMLFPKWS